MNSEPKQWDKQQVKRRASFLQSGPWAAFQQTVGSRPHYLTDDGWSCLLLERSTPLGKYLFAPYGPTLDSAGALDGALKQLRAYGRQAGLDWLCLEPMLTTGASGSPGTSLPKLGALPAAHNREPDLTRIINLKPPAGDILASISQSTRSFIRKNQRENFLSFKTSTEPADITIFTHMLAKVTDRKGVSFFSDDYFKKQAKALMPVGMMFLELALDNGQPVASALFHDFGKTSSYTFAASLPEARSTSASALLLWQAMLNAKQRGMEEMDLYGSAPESAPSSHPWYGFSSFKSKFGGEIVEYSGTWDIPLTGKYKLYRSAQKARRLFKRR